MAARPHSACSKYLLDICIIIYPNSFYSGYYCEFFMEYTYCCVSSICCSGGIWACFATLVALFFFLFFFSFQLSTLFFHIGLPDSSMYSSIEKTVNKFTNCQTRKKKREGYVCSSNPNYSPLSTVDTVLIFLLWSPASCTKKNICEFLPVMSDDYKVETL